MIQLNEIKLFLRELAAEGPGPSANQDSEAVQRALLPYLRDKAARALRISPEEIQGLRIKKQSLDARRKEELKFVFILLVEVDARLERKILARRLKDVSAVAVERAAGSGGLADGPPDNEQAPGKGRRSGSGVRRDEPDRPIVVGSGPAGLFAALTLAEKGERPIVLERGPKVEERVKAVEAFWEGGPLDPEANVQFGEGGAGTFSDGKLTTGIKDPRSVQVLTAFAAAGAPAEILYQAKPHIGTDRLRTAVANLRRRIEELGGSFYFNCKLVDLVIEEGALAAVIVESKAEEGRETAVPRRRNLPARRLILAPGHSARDTFAMLRERGIPMEAKPFSIGVRIEHRQELIDKSQYGRQAGHWALGPADYKLSCHLPWGRSVYSFCMCPGGQVVAAASEAGGVVTNGMSDYHRDSGWANSALLVGVTPADFPEPGPLGGVAFQRKYERLAYQAARNSYRAPADTVGRLLRQDKEPDAAVLAGASYRPGVTAARLEDFLPEFAVRAIREALPVFDRQIRGFADASAALIGVERRSSSPVRIPRDGGCQSAVRGVFPCGEGAGYAGGIMSAAVDGIRCAQAALRREEDFRG